MTSSWLRAIRTTIEGEYFASAEWMISDCVDAVLEGLRS